MKPTTISLLQKCKQEKKRFATITAYDYSFAKLFADEGINVMLVGDSLGMTIQGHDSTLACHRGRYRLPHSCRATWRAQLSIALRPAVYGLRHPGTGM
ncbi:3-methyl-2-oxobutanoatehydroxymethyl transferase [Salmonella enterica subsp. enterica serovar Daytona]|uniref:3-methyl-2-oxobutanoate hydroxymethyltransferase n=1 Tax=Salmonella enterica subsp. enterica serovar Daytona TaxID=1962639 RepID=A0A447JN85_SALET|nr:3-methyl-2-oxobutanoatehydroxymethyl transferase [Salmonella enterica subsp. enterica serovar Daytona]